jgi:hypothetical protein
VNDSTCKTAQNRTGITERGVGIGEQRAERRNQIRASERDDSGRLVAAEPYSVREL